MKILWLCNLVLPDFSDEFAIKRNNAGGWMSGMLHELEKVKEIEISLLFPIYDENRLRNGNCCGHNYYTFLSGVNEADNVGMVDTFVQVLENVKPDVVHIWGTEYYHSRAAVDACIRCHIVNRVIVDIQGLVSIYAKHYASGIPTLVIEKKDKNGGSILSEIEDFKKRGIDERYIFEKVKYVCGRTDWDEICVHQINLNLKYMLCNRILRKRFYECEESWNPQKCHRHTIFVSQASYAVKGLHFLLKALPAIFNRYPDTEVYIAGNNPTEIKKTGTVSAYGSYISEIIERNNLKRNIHFVGSLDENSMITFYLDANVFVSASNIENNSNSVCEAMYLGVPVVASDVGGMSSIVKHKIDGILYPFDAEYMLAGWVCKIFGNDDFALELSKGAKESARIRHNPEMIGKIMTENYAEVMKGCLNRENQ